MAVVSGMAQTSIGFRALVKRNVKLQARNTELRHTCRNLLEALENIFNVANDPTGLADPPLDDISELARNAIEAIKS